MKFSDLDFQNKEWAVGWNICRCIRFLGAPRAEDTVYRVILSNLFGKLLVLQYLVPQGQKPHQLLRDLKYFSDGNKPWIAVKIKWESGLPMITNIVTTGEDESQEEITQKSLLLRGGSAC